jgi:RHS repeat-associated protein
VVVQYNEYYPFGLQTANSWTRENITGNQFLANGTELNATSNLYDLEYRNYDPVLARMNGVDPLASKYASITPYNYSFNNPVSFTDPSGAEPANQDYRYQREHDMQLRANMDIGSYFRNIGFGSPLMSAWGAQYHITPGSGGNWADGSYYSDWSPNEGSGIYRAGLTAGYTDLGGKLRDVGSDTYINRYGGLADYNPGRVYHATIDWDALPENSQVTLFLKNGRLASFLSPQGVRPGTLRLR